MSEFENAVVPSKDGYEDSYNDLIATFHTAKIQGFLKTHAMESTARKLDPIISALRLVDLPSQRKHVDQICYNIKSQLVDAAENYALTSDVDNKFLEKINSEINSAHLFLLAEMNNVLSQIVQKQEKLRSEYENFLLELSNEKKNAEAKITEQKRKIIKLQDNYGEMVLRLKENYDHRFEEEENQRNKKVNEHIKNMTQAEEKFDKYTKYAWDTQKNYENKLAEKTKDYDSLSGNLQEMLKQASKDVEAIEYNIRALPAKGLGGIFDAAAKEEKRAANRLRLVSFLLLLSVMMIIVLTTFFPQISSLYAGDIEGIILRFGTIFTLFVPAGYASREAARHFARASYYEKRRFAFETMVADQIEIGAADKNSLRREIWDRFFNDLNADEKFSNSIGTDELIKLVHALKGDDTATEIKKIRRAFTQPNK